MNKAVLMGRLTREPETRYSRDTAVTKYTLAVDRKYKKEEGQQADFIPCTAFGKAGEFAEKYFHKGMKIAVTGRIQTGSYTDKEGRKVHTTDVIVEEQEFAESSRKQNENPPLPTGQSQDGFMTIPDGIEDELPFS